MTFRALAYDLFADMERVRLDRLNDDDKNALILACVEEHPDRFLPAIQRKLDALWIQFRNQEAA